ncbi:MAG: MATE family efflux transporter, partial [Clostridia bacterium]|nr:MATE family efflux transporter [Clostridia bacterium]
TLSLASKVPVWMQVDEPIQKLAATYFFILYMPMLPRAATIIFGTVLRSAGDTKTPMLIGIFVNAVNVILNFLLIYDTRTVILFDRSITLYGAGLGVIGAAIASAVAFTLGGIVITVALLCHKKISPLGYSFKPDAKILRPAMKVAVPNMLQRFGTSLGYVFFASMINSLGEISTAAHTIANTVESAFYIPAYGMQTAAATLAGNALGAADKKRMHDYTRVIIFIEIAMMLVSGGLLFAFAPEMMRIFNKDIAVISLGTVVLRMVALSEPFYGICIALEGMLQGIGNTKLPFVFNIIGMWGIRIVGTFICVTFFDGDLVSAWGCMILHNLVLFTMFLTYCTKRKNNPLYG